MLIWMYKNQHSSWSYHSNYFRFHYMWLKQFSKYFSVGVLNTLLHWVIFSLSYFIFDIAQSISNLVGFIVAVIFSFFMNAKFTFKQNVSITRFLSYTIFMGCLSYIIGVLADIFLIHPLFTPIIFSALSLICGFLYSKLIVFRR